jgi:hypothetical protein
MSDILLDTQAAPSSPSAGQVIVYTDTTTKLLSVRDENGFTHALDRLDNVATGAAQTPAAATKTYITNSNLNVPTGKLQIGTMFRWQISLTKTGAGTAASTFEILVGTAGTTADTTRLTFTKPAGTAVVDEGLVEIMVTCRGPLSASGVFVGEFRMTHNLSATGHMVIPACCVNNVSAAFDVTVANLIVGVAITTGAADAITIQVVQAEAINL